MTQILNLPWIGTITGGCFLGGNGTMIGSGGLSWDGIGIINGAWFPKENKTVRKVTFTSFKKRSRIKLKS